MLGYHSELDYSVQSIRIPPPPNREESPHNLQLVVRGPAHLRKTQTPLDTLEILASDLVAEDMRLLVAGV